MRPQIPSADQRLPGIVGRSLTTADIHGDGGQAIQAKQVRQAMKPKAIPWAVSGRGAILL